MTPEQYAYVKERWHQLYALLLDSVKVAINYLFIVNGGGCVAVLAFLGTEKAAGHKALLLVVLALFFVGLVLVGALNILRYRHFEKLERHWVTQSNKCRLGQITFDELLKADDALVETGGNIANWGYTSFFFLLLAGLVGFLGMAGITLCIVS
jgi:hypothetical protein